MRCVSTAAGVFSRLFYWREQGYYSLLNTRMDKEKQHLAAFLKAVADHADSIGFTGKLLIEPKPCEPTLHQ